MDNLNNNLPKPIINEVKDYNPEPLIGLNDIFEKQPEPFVNFVFKTPSQQIALERGLYDQGLSLSLISHKID